MVAEAAVTAISDDCRTVLATTANPDFGAYVWTEGVGLRTFSSYIVSRGVPQSIASGWLFGHGTAMTPDAQVFVVSGFDLNDLPPVYITDTHAAVVRFTALPVLPGEASSLLVRKGAPGQLTLEWSEDCGAATSNGIYRGDLQVGYHSIAAQPGACNVTGTSATIPLGSGSAEFFLVVPNKDAEEGSYGTDSFGAQRLPAASACYPQGAIQVCAP